jgi:DNA mismatch repair protein MutS2
MLQGQKITEQEILSRLLYSAFEAVRPYFVPLFQLIGDIEFYLAALGFHDFCSSKQRRTSIPAFLEAGETGSSLQGVYNPFLLAEGVLVRPCNVAARRNSIVILTGPNSGGKTRIMQSVALSQLLGQAGWPVPAESARLVFTGGLFVSMSDDVRADQREGRLGMELLRIRRLFEQINPGDLVFIDELCSGTNPSEGEEIFQLVLQLLGQLGPQVWLSTHFLKFAGELAEQDDQGQLQFLRVRLDAYEHPTFDFEPGVATTSLARQTAARLGVTREELSQLVEKARARGEARG